MAGALATLVVDETRMRANLDLAVGVARAEGLVAALAPAVGRHAALTLVEDLCRRALAGDYTLEATAVHTPALRHHLSETDITRALDPLALAGSSRVFVDRVLARWPRRKG